MRTTHRSDQEPTELSELRQRGGDNFGVLDQPLDREFGGVCAYCEREPLWRAPEDGLGAQDTDLTDEEGALFTCDHFRPRHLFPHLIYEWNNLIYACQACNGVKGGQWPGNGDEADSYVDPCADPSSGMDPDSVFEYRLDTGEIQVRDQVMGITRSNAKQTIDDLALNRHTSQANAISRNAKARRVDLATYREQRVKRVRETLDMVVLMRRDLMPALVGGFVSPRARFSSICRQFIRDSDQYQRYLI